MHGARVFLIGGAPGSGKTTLGCALAARVGGASVTIDDLMTVAQAVTTPESHPGLHVLTKQSHIDYFTNCSLERFQADTEAQHEAVWPIVKKLIAKHFNFTSTPIVMDGWHLRPHRVAELQDDRVSASWIHIAPSVLEERERANSAWLERSPDPEKMHRNFLARSLWFNELMKEQASAHAMRVLPQTGKTTAEELCDMILQH